MLSLPGSEATVRGFSGPDAGRRGRGRAGAGRPLPRHPADAGDGADRAADPAVARPPGSRATSGTSGRRAARTGTASWCRPIRCRGSTPRSLPPSGGHWAMPGSARNIVRVLGHGRQPVFRPEDVARHDQRRGRALVPDRARRRRSAAPVPARRAVPPRSAMNRFWPGALTWTHYLVGVCPSEPGQPVAVAVVAQSIGTTTKGQHATLELQLRHLEEVPGGASLPDAAGRVAELCAALDALEESSPRGGAGPRHRRRSAPSWSTCSTGACPSWSRSPAARRRASPAAAWPPCPGARSPPGCCSRRSGARSGRPARCRWRHASSRRCAASGSGRRAPLAATRSRRPGARPTTRSCSRPGCAPGSRPARCRGGRTPPWSTRPRR